MSEVKSVKRKQPTLAVFGFKKTMIVHKGVETEVKPPTEATEVLYPCDNCEHKPRECHFMLRLCIKMRFVIEFHKVIKKSKPFMMNT